MPSVLFVNRIIAIKHKRRDKRGWKFSRASIIPSILLTASFASLLYPHAAMWLSQYHMSEVAAQYAKLITNAVPAPHEQLARARDYNRKLSVGAIYEANTNIPTSHGDFDYLHSVRHKHTKNSCYRAKDCANTNCRSGT